MDRAPFEKPVRDYMSASLVSVLPTATAAEIRALLELRGISAVPLVDGEGNLRGVVSMTDLLRAPDDATAPVLAAHVMRKPALTVDVGATLADAARQMAEHRVHRLIVTEGAKPIGVVSTRDAMKALVEAKVLVPVADVTTTPVMTIDVGDTIDQALAQLESANVRGLVVVDGDWPVGVFTQLEALRAKALPPSFRARPVEDVMSYETICMDTATPLYRVAGHARATSVRRILVVEHKKLYGIASGFDLVRYLAVVA
jgi:predicted transcriptional regulator